MRNGQEPADTRMMGIVHGALRRDLLRIRTTVIREPYPKGDSERDNRTCI
jgi:hypothetical protein